MNQHVYINLVQLLFTTFKHSNFYLMLNLQTKRHEMFFSKIAKNIFNIITYLHKLVMNDSILV